MMPGCFQVGAHLQQTLTLRGTQGDRSLSDQCLQLLLQLVDRGEGDIPAPLEFASDKTIVRIDRIILPSRPDRLVSSLFERQLKLPLFLVRLMFAVRDRTDCRFNAKWLQQSHDLDTHCLVDPQSAERDTGGDFGIAPGRVAIIATDVAFCAVVADQ